jgi:hypothetical protein
MRTLDIWLSFLALPVSRHLPSRCSSGSASGATTSCRLARSFSATRSAPLPCCSSEVPFADLLLLANTKEQTSDIAGAIRYSDLAEKAAPDSGMKAEIHKKLLGLQSSLIHGKKP